MAFDYKHELQVVEGELVDKVEAKVKAASTAGALAGIVVSVLGHYVFKSGVPEVLQALIDAAITSGLTFLAGWLAKHTPRVIDGGQAGGPVSPVVTDVPPTPPAPPLA